jgi:hypothetical protein
MGLEVSDAGGVTVPRGMRKLKSLHTLWYVHLAWGNDVVMEIKGLTGLRKLGVVGISEKNSQNLSLAISNLSLLESLSLSSWLDLSDSLNGMEPPPENLQSLKLHRCRMARLPEWIKGLHNLVKLALDNTGLSRDGVAMLMQDIGNIRNLSILRLQEYIDITIGEVQFKSGLFMSLKVLELYFRSNQKIESVKFDEEAMPKLEVLRLGLDQHIRFFGLEYLQSIKEVWVHYFYSFRGEYKETFCQELREQLDRNKKGHVLKVVD